MDLFDLEGRPVAAPDRLTLAERRKQETRLEIARTAARLFAERGTAEVTAEEIAAAAGVALRTFYRYARTKEDAVEPMLATGAQRWLAIIASGPRRLPKLNELQAAAVRSMTLEDDADLELTRGLLRAMDNDAALRGIWHRINMESERDLTRVLTELAGPDADPLRVRLLAAAAAGAIRIALEEWALDTSPQGRGSNPASLAVRCMRALAGGI
ncbi:TetR family transcriptional regulator [Nocardia otitidiscaviarum]|uniref:TetR family transcriptional regulator n=1 Tax=Nocardia otitidiscaviarum TaxID=1823 RepID=A0A516NPY6_9NOCA|nr:TetR family transcriptional regulator [Nocardia otitidiscaviarum]